jgi:hypothetical protein
MGVDRLPDWRLHVRDDGYDADLCETEIVDKAKKMEADKIVKIAGVAIGRVETGCKTLGIDMAGIKVDPVLGPRFKAAVAQFEKGKVTQGVVAALQQLIKFGNKASAKGPKGGACFVLDFASGLGISLPRCLLQELQALKNETVVRPAAKAVLEAPAEDATALPALLAVPWGEMEATEASAVGASASSLGISPKAAPKKSAPSEHAKSSGKCSLHIPGVRVGSHAENPKVFSAHVYLSAPISPKTFMLRVSPSPVLVCRDWLLEPSLPDPPVAPGTRLQFIRRVVSFTIYDCPFIENQ